MRRGLAAAAAQPVATQPCARPETPPARAGAWVPFVRPAGAKQANASSLKVSSTIISRRGYAHTRLKREMAYHKQLGSALLYGVVSSLLTFSNKALPSAFNFNYPIFMLILQMALMQMALIASHQGGLIRYPRISAQGLVRHVPVSFLYCLNATLALASLQAVSIPTYGVLKRAGPLFVMMISEAAKYLHAAAMRGPSQSSELVPLGQDADQRALAAVEEGQPSKLPADGGGTDGKTEDRHRGSENGPGVVAGVVIIVLGAFLTGHADLYLTMPALVMAFLSNITQSTYVLLVEAKHNGKAGIGTSFDYGAGIDPTLGLLAYNSILSLPTLLVFTILLYAILGSKVLGFLHGDLYTVPLVGTMLLVALLGISLNYCMFLCIRNNSALTTVMVGHCKTMVQTVLGFFVLAKDVHPSTMYVFGVALSFVGGFLFTMAKYQQSLPTGASGAWTWKWWADRWKGVSAIGRPGSSSSDSRDLAL